MNEWMPKNPYSGLPREWHQIFADGCRQTALKLVKWLEQLCITPNHIQCGLRRGCCPECLEELKKEVEL